MTEVAPVISAEELRARSKDFTTRRKQALESFVVGVTNDPNHFWERYLNDAWMHYGFDLAARLQVAREDAEASLESTRAELEQVRAEKERFEANEWWSQQNSALTEELTRVRAERDELRAENERLKV